MKYRIRHTEVCTVIYRFEIEAQSEEEALSIVRKGRAGKPVAYHVEPMGYPTMTEIEDDATRR
jgi:hypothetical protein